MLRNLTALLLTGAIAFQTNQAIAAETGDENQPTLIYQGEYQLETFKTTPLKIKADNFTNVAAGDAITVKFTVGNTYNYCTIDLCYGNTKLACNKEKTNTKNDGNFAPTATETSVTLTDEADIAGLKKSGLQIKGKNVTISAVYLGTGEAPDNPDNPDIPDNPTDITDLWTGSADTGNWANDVTVKSAAFESYKGGDILTIFLTVNPDAKYGVLELADINYTQLECDRTAKELDSYGSIQPGTTRLTYVITNYDMELLKENGLRVKGANVTITRIGISIGEALPDEPVDETKSIVWKGNLNCGRWAESISVPAEKFDKVKADDKLIINATKNQRVKYGEIELQDNAGNILDINGKGINLDAEGYLPKDVSEVIYTLGSQDASRLKESGLLLKGSAITVTRITLEYVGDRSGIYTPEAEMTDMETVYYSLQGVRVATPSTGIYIAKKGNTVSKVVID